MTGDGTNYREAVETIKGAILQAQYAAAKSANAQQLQLYFAVGGYLPHQSEMNAWGSGAIDAISEMLQRDLPGLRGFSGRNLRLMRTFYREWSSYLVPTSNLELANSELPNERTPIIWNLQLPNSGGCSLDDFFSIGFTHHR